MPEKEIDKLNRIASRINTHEDFDAVLARYTGKIVGPRVKGKRVLEAGCSTGVMTPMLLDYAKSLSIVEGSPIYAKAVKKKYGSKIDMTCCMFEEYRPNGLFDSVVFSSVLHHLDNPVAVLTQAKTWVKKGGEIHLTAPNMNSFHRELGVAMKLNQTVYDRSPRNIFFAQPGRFDKSSFEKTVRSAGFTLIESFGFFFKPFPHEIMNSLKLKEDILNGLFEMGMKYPKLACQLYIRAIR